MTPWLVKEASAQREALREVLMKRDRGLAAEWKSLVEGADHSILKDKAPEKAPEKKPEAKPATKPAEKAPEKK